MRQVPPPHLAHLFHHTLYPWSFTTSSSTPPLCCVSYRIYRLSVAQLSHRPAINKQPAPYPSLYYLHADYFPFIFQIKTHTQLSNAFLFCQYMSSSIVRPYYALTSDCFPQIIAPTSSCTVVVHVCANVMQVSNPDSTIKLTWTGGQNGNLIPESIPQSDRIQTDDGQNLGHMKHYQKRQQALLIFSFMKRNCLLLIIGL